MTHHARTLIYFALTGTRSDEAPSVHSVLFSVMKTVGSRTGSA